ncbi:MAG: DUF4412 domain-containing protein [bacterium]
MKKKRIEYILAAMFCFFLLFSTKSAAAAPEDGPANSLAGKQAETVRQKEAGKQAESAIKEGEEPKGEAKPGIAQDRSREKETLSEEFYFEKTTQTFINGEQAGPEKKLEVWLKGNRIRYESDDKKDMFVIIMMDKGKTYELDKFQKTYKETSYELGKLKEMSERSLVVSKKTGQKKKIKDWNCYEVVLDSTIQGNKMKATCWLTEDIKVSEKVMQKMAKFSQMKLMEELAKYPGYPVLLTMDSTIQGKQVRVLSTLVKIDKEPLKESFFKIPFEYTKAVQ